MATIVSANIRWIDYARGLLHNLGVPDTTSNEDALLAWMDAEQQPESPFAAWNPLNTHKVEAGSKNTNGHLEQSYPDSTAGIKATGDTIRQANFAGILAALKAGNNPIAVLRAVQASGWAAGHYGSSGDLAGLLPTIQGNRSRFANGKIAATSNSVGGITGDGSTGDILGAIPGELGDAAGNAASDLAGSIGAQLTKIVVLGTLVAGGVALLVAGAYQGVSPQTKAKVGEAAATAGKVAAA